MLRSAEGMAPTKTHANGRRVKVEEWEMWFDRTAGRAALQSHGLRSLLTEETSSGQTAWYPRFGEGQNGAAHSVPNKAWNARPRAPFGRH